MSLASGTPLRNALRHELEVLQGNWVWYLVLGIGLIVLGTIALGMSFLATLTAITFLGFLLVFGGFSQILGAFWARQWTGFFTLLLIGVMYLVAGIMSLMHPVEAATTLTLVIGMMLMIGGLFRIIAALSSRFPNWVWVLVNGVITLLLGILIWRQWPGDSVWVIGTFVAIEMIFNGWTWVMFALLIKKLPKSAAPAT